MTHKHFTLSILVICILTVNVFAQKNANIEPQVQEAKSAEQPQSTVIMHTQQKKVKPLYQQVTKIEAATKVKQATPKAVSQPKLGNIARPNIYTNLDENIQKWEQKAATIEADPNRDENTLIKHKATLERLRKISAERPKGQ